MLGNQKIRIKLKGYNSSLVTTAVDEIIQTVRRSGGRAAGPIPFPTHTKKITIQRATFVNKKARDQFEIRTHKRVIDIIEPTQQTVDELSKLELPTGLNAEIQLMATE